MKKKLNQIAKDTNLFLKRYIRNQKKTDLIVSMKYGLFPGGKKIRSKILFDIGQLFNVDYQSLIKVSAAVELKGKIQVEDKILKDPFDDKECVYWRIHIQELVKSGKTRKWVTRHKAKNQVPFLISDQTGSVLIYLDDVNMNDVKRDKQYDLATFFSDEIPPIIQDYCRKYNVKLKGWFGGKKRMRLTVTYLEPDDDIYILGNARPVLKDELKNSKNVAAVIDMSKRGLFIISDKSEKELIDENGGQSFAVPFGIILSTAGLSMILNSLGYI